MPDSTATLMALRHAFDGAFQRPRERAIVARDKLVVVRVGRREVAVALAEVTQIVRRPRITPIPSRTAALVGIGAWHGALVGMFDIASLIGEVRTAPLAAEDAAWAVLARGGGDVGLVGFVFDALVQYVDAAPEDIATPADGDTSGRVLRVDGAARTIVTMSELIRLSHPQAKVPTAAHDEETA